MSRSTAAAAARLAASAARRVASAPSMQGAGTLRGERLLHAAGRTTPKLPPKTNLAAPTGAAAARAPPTTTPPVYGLELAAGAGGVAAASARLLSAGAPAEPVASLLAAASARPDSMTHLLDMGAVAAAAGASAQTVAAACGRKFSTGDVVLAADLGTLSAASRATGKTVTAIDIAPLAAAACGRKLATGDVVLAVDLGALAAAAATGKTVDAIYVAPLAAAACGQKLPTNAVVPALDLDGLVASAVIDVAALAAARDHNFDTNAVLPGFDLGALAAAAGGPAQAANGFGTLAAAVAAHGRELGARSPASSPTADGGPACARPLLAGLLATARSPASSPTTDGGATIFGRNGRVLSFAARGGFGVRMMCTGAAGRGSEPAMAALVSTAATKEDINELRAEMLQHYLKSSKESNKMWEEINAL